MTNDERDAEIGMLKLAAARDAETIRILQDQVNQQLLAEPNPVLLDAVGFLSLVATGPLPANYREQATVLVNKLGDLTLASMVQP